MPDRIHIPKEDDWDKNGRPVWHATANQDKSERKPLVVCNCGARLGLGNHSISPNGEVNPSFWHRDLLKENDNQACGWHVWITLDDWSGSSFPTGDL